MPALRLCQPGCPAVYAFAAAQVERFQRDPAVNPIPRPLAPPPGQPIGCTLE
ncbi:MAG: hypothetical protein JNM66_22260 [Bryobacterales bacterium]|nr:hypothetical protein [Bryobacterales bacterium]